MLSSASGKFLLGKSQVVPSVEGRQQPIDLMKHTMPAVRMERLAWSSSGGPRKAKPERGSFHSHAEGVCCDCQVQRRLNKSRLRRRVMCGSCRRSLLRRCHSLSEIDLSGARFELEEGPGNRHRSHKADELDLTYGACAALPAVSHSLHRPSNARRISLESVSLLGPATAVHAENTCTCRRRH